MYTYTHTLAIYTCTHRLSPLLFLFLFLYLYLTLSNIHENEHEDRAAGSNIPYNTTSTVSRKALTHYSSLLNAHYEYMDDYEQARAGHMVRVRDEAQHGMRSSVDLATRSITMLHQQTERTWETSRGSNGSITVAIDFGTSNTAVALSKDGDGSRPIITDIKHYPDDPMTQMGNLNPQVPTETWYSDLSTISRPTDAPSVITTDYSGDDELELNIDQNMSEETMDDQGSEFEFNSDRYMAGDRMDLDDPAEDDMEGPCWGYGVRWKLIHPIELDGINTKRHYKIEFDLIMIGNGRNLRFEARWQSHGGSKGAAHTDISITAAFTPGTE